MWRVVVVNWWLCGDSVDDMTVGGGILYSDHQPLLDLHNHRHGIRKFIVGHIFSYCYFHSPPDITVLLLLDQRKDNRFDTEILWHKCKNWVRHSSKTRKRVGKESHLVDIELWTDFQSILWIYIYDTLLMTGRLPFRPCTLANSFSGEPEWRKLDRRRGWCPACLWLIVFRGGVIGEERRLARRKASKWLRLVPAVVDEFSRAYTISGTWDSERVLLTALVVGTG